MADVDEWSVAQESVSSESHGVGFVWVDSQEARWEVNLLTVHGDRKYSKQSCGNAAFCTQLDAVSLFFLHGFSIHSKRKAT